ncbi:MAG: hypothetical protein ACLT0Y_06770 [Christensenellales bacterium]
MKYAAADVVSIFVPVTLIQKDGAVLYRCPANAGAEENHLQREEVQQALKTGQGVATRYSTTLGKNMCYIAVTTGDGAYIVRLGQQMDTVNAANRQMALEIILLSGICLAGLLVLDWRMSCYRPINEMTAVRLCRRALRAKAGGPIKTNWRVGGCINSMSTALVQANETLLRDNPTSGHHGGHDKRRCGGGFKFESDHDKPGGKAGAGHRLVR